MAKKPEAAAAESEVPKKKGKKLVLIAGILVLALGGGGAGAWYFMRPSDEHAEKAPEPEKPSQFLALESFTVNLVSAEGQPQYLQAGLTLKVGHDVKLDTIKERMPEIRNRILLVLSGKKASDLLPVSGKQKLATELSDSIRDILGDSAGLKPAAKPAKKAKKVEVEEAEAEESKDSKEGKEAKESKESKVAKAAKAPKEDKEEKDEKEGSETAKAEGEAKPAKKAKAAATHVAKGEVEVLFTSFIIQ